MVNIWASFFNAVLRALSSFISLGIVTDLINWIVQVLKKDLERLVVSTQDTGLIKPIKL